MVNVFVFGGAKVATKEQRLDAFQKRRISRHDVFELPVLRAILSHDDLAIVFDDLGFNFAGMLVHQHVERRLTRDHGVANFFYAAWAQTVGFAREAKWRSGALVGFEQRTRGPV